MKRQLIGILNAFIIFTIMINIDKYYKLYILPLLEISESANNNNKMIEISTLLKFKEISSSFAIAEDRNLIYTKEYQSSDGEQLTKLMEFKNSQFEAIKIYEKTIKGASKIIESGANLTNNGICNGYRALVLFNTKNYKTNAVIIWTDNNIVFRIEGPSLIHVISLENKRKPIEMICVDR